MIELNEHSKVSKFLESIFANKCISRKRFNNLTSENVEDLLTLQYRLSVSLKEMPDKGLI